MVKKSLLKYGLTQGLAATVFLSGCATVFEGTTQEISVVSNPPGATCAFEREGYEVGRIASTPGTANIRKSKHDLIIRCTKPGYAEATYLNHSGTTSTIAANVAADLILTAGISSIVDSADGADNKYDTAVNISLTPLAAPVTPVAYVQPVSAQPATVAQTYAALPVATQTAAISASSTATAKTACSKEDLEFIRLAQERGYSYQPPC